VPGAGAAMRTAGEIPPPPAGPFGERLAPARPSQPEWRPQPGNPAIEVNRQGQLRTNLPLPK